MFRSLRFANTVRIVTVCALVSSQQVIAAPPVANPNSTAVHESNTPGMVDVTLGDQGVLQGYVVDSQGIPAMGIEVKLQAPNGRTFVTRSDHKGRFGYRGLQGAAYQLETELGVVAFRAWSASTAPPRAAATLLVVHDNNLVRGQWSAPPALNGSVRGMKRAFTNPFFVATVVGAAVAIPVAIHNANQDDSSS